MPSPVSSAFAVCQPTSITTLKLICYNKNDCNLKLSSQFSPPESWLLYCINIYVCLHRSGPLPETQLQHWLVPSALALLVFAVLSFNHLIKHELERLDLGVQRGPFLIYPSGKFFYSVESVLQSSTNLNPNFNPAIN